jgi:hypothetical protein
MDGLGQLRELLDSENAHAFEHAHAWAAQLILEQRSTQILVVSDSPEQNRAVNHRLETALHRLDAQYRVTSPIEIRSPTPDPDARRRYAPQKA